MRRFALVPLLFLVACTEPADPLSPPVAATGTVATPSLPAQAATVDDFEIRVQSEEVWHAVVSGEQSRADRFLAEGGVTEASQFHLAVDVVRPEVPALGDVAGVVARLSDAAHGRDVSAYDGVRFAMKATPGLYIVQLGSARVTDHDHFNGYVEVAQEGWMEYRLPFASFRQEGYGAPVAWTGRDLVHVGVFSLRPGSSSFALDDIVFYAD